MNTLRKYVLSSKYNLADCPPFTQMILNSSAKQILETRKKLLIFTH